MKLITVGIRGKIEGHYENRNVSHKSDSYTFWVEGRPSQWLPSERDCISIWRTTEQGMFVMEVKMLTSANLWLSGPNPGAWLPVTEQGPPLVFLFFSWVLFPWQPFHILSLKVWPGMLNSCALGENFQLKLENGSVFKIFKNSSHLTLLCSSEASLYTATSPNHRNSRFVAVLSGLTMLSKYLSSERATWVSVAHTRQMRSPENRTKKHSLIPSTFVAHLFLPRTLEELLGT